MPSVTVAAIRNLSQLLKPRLADSGWRRRSPHFTREAGSVIHGIHFQASHFGSSDAGQFTVNLMVTEPRIYQAWCRRPLPANPASALFPVQMRIGHLDTRPRDRWWEITGGTDLSVVEDELYQLLQKAGEEFFPRFRSMEAMVGELRAKGTLPGLTGGQSGVVHGLIAALLGHIPEAQQVLGNLIADNRVPGFVKNVREAARQVGIEI